MEIDFCNSHNFYPMHLLMITRFHCPFLSVRGPVAMRGLVGAELESAALLFNA